MDLSPYFKSIIEQDKCPVLVCNLEHFIIYVNPAAIARYAGYGGDNLVGKNLKDCHNPRSVEMMELVVNWFASSPSNNRIFTHHSESENKDIYMIALRNSTGRLIGYYEKHEYRSPETARPYNFKQDHPYKR